MASLEAFINQRCAKSPGVHTPFRDFYDAFQVWLNGRELWSKKRVSRRLPDEHATRRGTNNRVLIRNLSLARNTMKIVGLGHYSRVGKDTLANHLIHECQSLASQLKIKKIPFAWKLKDLCHQLYGWAGVREPEFYETPDGASLRDEVLAPLGMTPVQLWVALGTPAIRERVYDRTWIDYVMRSNHDADIIIIPDVRFPNETQAIRNGRGLLIKVVRDGYGPRDTVADQALVGWKDWDYVFGPTLADLLRQGSELARCLVHDNEFQQNLETRNSILAMESQ